MDEHTEFFRKLSTDGYPVSVEVYRLDPATAPAMVIIRVGPQRLAITPSLAGSLVTLLTEATSHPGLSR